MEWSATRRRISLTTNTPLHRFSAYQPIGIDKRLFTPLERQRLILSILQARPIDDGAAVDTLMATKDDRSMAWRMALPKEKQAEQEAFDDEILEKTGIDMETEADLLRYEARGGSVLTHVFAVHDIRTRYRIHQKWHRGCPRLYGPARTLLYLDDLRDYFGEKVAAVCITSSIHHHRRRHHVHHHRSRLSSSGRLLLRLHGPLYPVARVRLRARARRPHRPSGPLPEPVRSGLHGGGAARDRRR